MKVVLALVLAAAIGMPSFAAPDPLDGQGRRFVVLATSLGRLYPAEIDAYWGPPELDARKRGPAVTLAALRADTAKLRGAVWRDAPSPRRARLLARLDQFDALLAVIAAPHTLSFDMQAQKIFGLAPPAADSKSLDRARAVLARELPGRGAVAGRLAAWRARFVIPDYRRRAVFLRALAECRARTAAHWPLPPGEKLDLEWGADVPAAWHRYQGHGRSLLQVNPDAVADPGTALDVACHEGYPGHHAQFLALDAAAPPVEDTVAILRSADQAMREGAAEAGVALAFPDAARLAFTRDVLFPLAGFDPRQAARFEAIRRAAAVLSGATLPILRDYYDGRMASGDALARLMLEAGAESPVALLEFTRQTGAYVAGYTAARQAIAACLRSVAAGQRWSVLRAATGRETRCR